MLTTAPDDEIIAEMLALQSELTQQVCPPLMEGAFCSMCTTHSAVLQERSLLSVAYKFPHRWQSTGHDLVLSWSGCCRT